MNKSSFAITVSVLGGLATSASADTHFSAGALILPAPASYQNDCGSVAVYGLSYDLLRANAWLVANGYSKIEVYYAYKDTKGSPNRCTPTNLHTPPTADPRWDDGCDFNVSTSTLVPVKLVVNSTATNLATDLAAFSTMDLTSKTSGATSVYPNWPSKTIQHTALPATNTTIVRYWGGSFVIDDVDAVTVRKLISGSLTAYDAAVGGNAIDFTPFRTGTPASTAGCTWGSTVGGYVNIHAAQVPFDAPTPKIFTSKPPRLALLARNANQNPNTGASYPTNAGASSLTGRVADTVLQNYLSRGGLNFAGARGCPTGSYISSKQGAGGGFMFNTTAEPNSFCPVPNAHGQIYDVFDFQDIVAGRLGEMSAGQPVYKMLWAPHWEYAGAAPTANEKTAIDKMVTFLDGQAGLMAECASVEMFEGVAAGWQAPHAAYAPGHFQTCKVSGASCSATPATYGLVKNSGSGSPSLASDPSAELRNCSDPNMTNGSDCAYYSYPGDPYSQTAEYRWDSVGYPVGSHVADFKPAAGQMYKPGVLPLISGVTSLDTTKIATPAAARAIITGDYATRGYKDNDPTKSNILYLSNHDLSGSVAGTKIVLQTLLQLGDPPVIPTMEEVTRSTPIVATISNTSAIVQGTYESWTPTLTTKSVTVDADAATFTFPYLLGHMRAVDSSAIGATATGFASLTKLFDAATKIPAATLSGCGTNYTGACRTVFTHTVGTLRPPRVLLNNIAATVTTLKPFIAPTLLDATNKTIIEKVLGGSLGGVDHSTVAVIGDSLVTGTSRAQMIYFGAADGMLHAACGSTVAGGVCGESNCGDGVDNDSDGQIDEKYCTSIGQEIWAFLPRKMLPKLRMNTQLIEGSPRVADLFGDFDGNGSKEFRTILMFQTGTGVASVAGQEPAAYALDVTDPTNPIILWEKALPGAGVAMTAGKVLIAGVNKSVAFAQTNGDTTAGAYVTAIDVETGNQVWQSAVNTDHPYPAPRVAASGAVPFTGVPGGAVGVDLNGTGRLTDVISGTLYGDIWHFDAATGANKHGTAPMFRFTTDKKPFGVLPTIYNDGTGGMFAALISGGYFDFAAGTLWSAASGQQIVAVNLRYAGTTALTEGSGGVNVPYTYTLGANEKGFAQVEVVGTQLYATTETDDINQTSYGSTGNTGKVIWMDVANGGNVGSVVVAGGAGSVANTGTTVFASSKDSAVRLGTAAKTSASASTNLIAPASVTRRLWLRTL